MASDQLNAESSGPFLAGRAVGISIAFGEDSVARGFTEDEMNRSVVRLSDALLAAGANLVFGHDWRPNGVMAAVARLAVRYEPPAGGESGAVQGQCRITNLVPWDSRAELPEELRRDLESRGILRVEEVPLPAGVAEHQSDWGKPTVRAIALSALRQRLAKLCHARVCLGGKFQRFEGFWPGILEEAWSSATQEQPVYLSGLLGGAALRVLEAARTGQWDLLIRPPAAEDLRRGLEISRDFPGVSLPDFRGLPVAMTWERLQTQSGLSADDWQRLTGATDIEVVTALVLKGLRLKRGAK